MFNPFKKTNTDHRKEDILLRKWCIEIASAGCFSYDKSIVENAKRLYEFLTGSSPMEEVQEQKK